MTPPRRLADTALTLFLVAACLAAIALFLLLPPDATATQLVYRSF